MPATLPRRARGSGATLAELMVVLAIVGLLASMVLPSLARIHDGLMVRGAANEVMMAFFAARSRAIDDARLTTVVLDGVAGRVAIVARGETLLARPVAASRGVTLSASRPTAAYFPDGLGLGGANLTVVLSRGAAAETVLVSREGRVRLGGRGR
ncbi:MAG TPA: GspH/FimT family pseudopilin [Gemmatimonadaceae bacterium]